MIKVEDCGIILESRENAEFENGGVLNPACIEKDGIIHMFYRAVRKDNFSTIGYCQIKDNKVIYQADSPILVPEYTFESKGMEDPRITFLDGTYFMLYTAYDGINATVAYATSTDLKNFKKQGLISPQITNIEVEDIFRNSNIQERYNFFAKFFKQAMGDQGFLWEKDSILFPKKFNGKFALIHRVLPGMQICYFDDFNQLTLAFWREYLKNLGDWIIMDPKYQFESSYIGSGCIPIETNAGWLLIYHAVEITGEGKIYRAAAALLDKDDPQKVLGRLPYPLFSPNEKWEKQGVVDNVVFPTGAIIKNDILFIYYGAADLRIAVKSLNINDLIKELVTN
jgi:beta-1,2-mannobiose phosphorylase / 1,2-beta-oligomannan phosphorylase